LDFPIKDQQQGKLVAVTHLADTPAKAPAINVNLPVQAQSADWWWPHTGAALIGETQGSTALPHQCPITSTILGVGSASLLDPVIAMGLVGFVVGECWGDPPFSELEERKLEWFAG
jgi:hypothetical protein